MTQPALPYALDPEPATQIGLIVLQSDETIELDFRRLVPPHVELFVSRVPSAETVSPETLAQMEAHLGSAAGLFPQAARFASVGYGCTSGTAQIGAAQVARAVQRATTTDHVSNPLSALIAACRALGITRLGVLSPYVQEVSNRLRDALRYAGIDTPVFRSFDVPEEAKVVRVDQRSIIAGAEAVAASGEMDALFVSCTNLRTLDVLPTLEQTLGMPVLSSNQVLAWHLLSLAGVRPNDPSLGALGKTALPPR